MTSWTTWRIPLLSNRTTLLAVTPPIRTPTSELMGRVQSGWGSVAKPCDFVVISSLFRSFSLFIAERQFRYVTFVPVAFFSLVLVMMLFVHGRDTVLLRGGCLCWRLISF